MRTKFNGILTLFLALVVQISFAQDRTITGTVSDESGPLPGVSVLKKGTLTGTETDFDGNYSIKAKTGDVLIFSFVGTKTVSKTLGTSNQMNILLENDILLEEVIVVGYGTSTKESFTGTIKTVASENIDAKAVANVAQALAGEASGVSVVRTNNRPGQAARIRIRGFSSVQGNRDPLYVVDGVQFSGSLNSINPSDIASTSILKDATATAIYGARGANGVVLITTKKGRAGKFYIEFDSKTSINDRTLPVYDMINNEEEYISLVYNKLKNTAELDPAIADPTQHALSVLFDSSSGGIAPLYNMWNVADGSELIDINTGKVRNGVTRKFSPVDWADHGYQTGIRQDINLKIGGGSEKTNHFFSIGYLDDKGYINNSQYNRYSARINLDSKPTKWLKASTNLGYVHSINDDATGYGGGVVTYMLDYTPTIYPLFLRDQEGNIVMNDNTGSPFYDFGDNTSGNARSFSATYNGVGESIYNINRITSNSVNGNVNFVIDLFEGLTFETSYGLNLNDSNLGRTRNSIQGSSGVAVGGSLLLRNSTYIAQNFNQIVRFKKGFGNHNIEAIVAHETNEDSFTFSDINKKGIVNLNPDAALVPDNYIEQNGNSQGLTRRSKLESYFGQVNYDFNNKYYLSGTLRRDGTSRFLNNKWGTFWSLGAGWVVSKENFLKSSNFLSYLKLKASYGVLGDQGGVNTRVTTLTDSENYSGADYYGGQGGFDIGSLSGSISLLPRPIIDENITWETSNQFQTGIELEFFNGRIEANMDYYRKTTKNLFVDKQLAASQGDQTIRTNDGELLNQGFEFDITGHIIKKDDFSLSLSVNGELFDNEILAMPIENSTGFPKAINIVDDIYGHSKGSSIYDYYIREWAGVDPTNGDPQWTQHWVDSNNNETYDAGEGIDDLVTYQTENSGSTILQRKTSEYADATLKYIDGKSVIPTIRGAFRINTSFKQFSLSTQFGYSIGGYGYDSMYSILMSNGLASSSSYHTDIRNSWKKPGDITDVPRVYSNQNVNANRISSRFITSTDYLALNNIRFGYTLPKTVSEQIGIGGLDLWISGDNLFLLSERKGYNPTTSVTGVSGRYTYNPITTYTFGVRVRI